MLLANRYYFSNTHKPPKGNRQSKHPLAQGVSLRGDPNTPLQVQGLAAANSTTTQDRPSITILRETYSSRTVYTFEFLVLGEMP